MLRLQFILTFLIQLSLCLNDFLQNDEDLMSVGISQSNLIIVSGGNQACHRTWNVEFLETLKDLKVDYSWRERVNNSTLLSPNDKNGLHIMDCRKSNQPNRRFCIMDRSPFYLHWAFFSEIVCKNLETGESFGVSFDRTRFESARSHLAQPKLLKYLKVIKQRDPNNLHEEVLEAAGRIFRRADFHSQTKGFISVVILIRTIAEHLNSTILPLEMEDGGKGANESVSGSPTIHPRIFGRRGTTLNGMTLVDSLRYARIEPVDFNFVYCAAPQLRSAKIYDMTVIFQAFQPNLWFLLGVMILTSSLLLSRTCIPNDCIAAFLTLFTSLLGGNFRFGLGRIMQKSEYFTGWMLISIVLNNYYTGSMTSLLIAPLGESVLGRLEELYGNNYRFIFPAPAMAIFQLVNVSAYAEDSGRDRGQMGNESDLTLERRYNHSREMEMLRGLLGSNSKDHTLLLPIPQFVHALAVDSKKAAFGPWTYTVGIYKFAMKHLKDMNAKLPPSRRISRHCYVGQKLVASGGLFWGFLPPSNEAPAVVFQELLENGIYNYWMEDFYGLNYASRVQDRSQVKSPTRILPRESEEGGGGASMGLGDGHTSTVFFLWSVGMALTGVAFTSEIFVNRFRKVAGAE